MDSVDKTPTEAKGAETKEGALEARSVSSPSSAKAGKPREKGERQWLISIVNFEP